MLWVSGEDKITKRALRERNFSGWGTWISLQRLPSLRFGEARKVAIFYSRLRLIGLALLKIVEPAVLSDWPVSHLKRPQKGPFLMAGGRGFEPR